jgi:hypothetical protein
VEAGVGIDDEVDDLSEEREHALGWDDAARIRLLPFQRVRLLDGGMGGWVDGGWEEGGGGGRKEEGGGVREGSRWRRPDG